MRFIYTLTEHKVLGFIINAYYYQNIEDKPFFSVQEQVVDSEINKHKETLSELDLKILKLIKEYSDQELVKVFSKKKQAVKDFYNTIKNEQVENFIKPYVEKRVAKVLKYLSRKKESKLFLKDLYYSNVYEADEIQLEKEPAKAIFNFTREETGIKYFLSIRNNDSEINLSNSNGRIISNSPCNLLLHHKIFYFNDIDGKKLLPFFTKSYVNIPKSAEKKYFETFIHRSLEKYEVKAKGFNVQIVNPEPKPTISIENDLNGNPALLVNFDYGHDFKFNHNQKTEIIVKLHNIENEYQYLKFSRDFDQEGYFFNKLFEKGLSSNDKVFFYLKKNQSINELINWINTNYFELSAAGFQIVQKFQKKKFFTGNIEINLKISDKNDWFDIYGTVVFGEFEIPFIKLKNYILKDVHEYKLPNGEIAILPDEWFSKYRSIMQFGDKTMGESLKLNKYHFGLLNDSVEEGMDNKYTKRFEKLTNISDDIDFGLPENLNATLRPYQKTGYNWLHHLYNNYFGGCLADDMGLGKTIQTLTLLLKLIPDRTKVPLIQIEKKEKQLSLFSADDNKKASEDEVLLPVLIVLPSSLVHNWENEILKYTPGFKIYKFVGIDRTVNIHDFFDYDIILTTYGIVRNEIERISQIQFFYAILDESQIIKNPESKVYKAVTQINAQHRLVLTGTPIENSLSDLWSQINFINPGLLGNITFFKNEFVTPIEKFGDDKCRDKLKEIIRPFILRRSKKEVAKDLPELTEQYRYCDMLDEQKSIYEAEKSTIRNTILESIEENGIAKSSFMVLQALTKLRQIANHPVLIDKKFPYESGKFNETTRILSNILQDDHKVLIFSSFVKHLQLFEQRFKNEGIKYTLLTGATKNRQKVVKEFQEDTECKVFLISLKAGGVGLNLTAADYVFILDPWWNPAVENQAVNRAHRIGQTKNVIIYRFISNDSIEEKIINLQQRKAQLADDFISSSNPFKAMTKNQIEELFL